MRFCIFIYFWFPKDAQIFSLGSQTGFWESRTGYCESGILDTEACFFFQLAVPLHGSLDVKSAVKLILESDDTASTVENELGIHHIR